ncbi:MAG TPA: TonB-dependent receptor [Steroidobacteraceae bacterium]|nr:TonB-dependent receptor [Steroidobacteraceae bacterium]
MKASVKLALFVCCAVSAWATTPVRAAPAGEGQLEEIVVTAQKRKESLQDVPIAVSAVKAGQLEAVGVTSMLDLHVAVPTLNSSNTVGQFTSTIRGVGSFGFGPGIESPIALYVDGVYLAAPQASALSLNNIESVEVLKGPQGTLFGRNATGGLIQVTTATPTSQPRGKFSLSYGNYQTVEGAAYLSGGIAEGLAADLAFHGKSQGQGYGRNITTGNDNNKLNHEISLRSKWVWQLEGTTATFIGDYSTVRDNLSTFTNVPGKQSGFVPGRISPDLGYDTESDRDTVHEGWSAGGSLRIDHDFAAMRLTSITAYRKQRYDFTEDLDFTALDLEWLKQRQIDRQITQELQLTSTGHSRLQWTTGLYYFNNKSDYPGFILDRQNIDLTSIGVNNSQKSESAAVFGQATYEVLEGTRVTLGARYTHEVRKEVGAELDLTLYPPASFPSPVPVTLPIPFLDREITFNKGTYRLSVDHRFSDTVLAYVSYNEGFKAGGFNTINPGDPPFKPESIKAYEAGLKSDLLDRRLRLNVAGFYYDYTNIQVPKINVSTLSIINGATARIYGMDLDATAVISSSFTVTGGVGWIAPTFRDFKRCPFASAGGGVPPFSGTCDGHQVPFASKFVASLAATYTMPVANGNIEATGNVYENSGLFFEPDNLLKQGSYALVGASARWVSDHGLSVGAYGKNLGNRRVINFAATQGGGNQTLSYGEPRTYGMTVGYEF